MHMTDCIKRAKHAHRGMWHVGGHVPPEKFLISDLLRLLLVSFWGETAGVGRPTANLVIVFETFKCSHNLRRGSLSPRRGKNLI